MARITELPEISELDLIAELLRIMCDEHVIDGDAMFDFAVARGLAEHLRANYRVVLREDEPDRSEPINGYPAASVLHGQVDFYCDRHQRRVGHKPHDGCPGHPGRHVPAEQLADLPDRAGIRL